MGESTSCLTVEHGVNDVLFPACFGFYNLGVFSGFADRRVFGGWSSTHSPTALASFSISTRVFAACRQILTLSLPLGTVGATRRAR